MEKLRKGESTTYPFRSDRMFTIGHEWFFSTREGNEKGPFRDRKMAEVALSRFITTVETGGNWRSTSSH